MLGRVGYVSLAVVFGSVGWFLIKAAVDFDARKLVGLGGALATLAHAAYGKWLLGATASSLLVYAAFGFAQVATTEPESRCVRSLRQDLTSRSREGRRRT